MMMKVKTKQTNCVCCAICNSSEYKLHTEARAYMETIIIGSVGCVREAVLMALNAVAAQSGGLSGGALQLNIVQYFAPQRFQNTICMAG